MNLTKKIAAAINANGGQCPVIEEALIESFDFVAARTPADCNPSIEVLSVFGRARIKITDGLSMVTLDVSPEGVKRLIQEFETVLNMAD
jgi:hypothetical protein